MSPNFRLRPLLCQSPLFPNESLTSYLNRLAVANCYKPFSLLANLIRRHLSIYENLQFPKHPETFDLLGTLARTSPRKIANASIHHFVQSPVFAEREKRVIYLSDNRPFWLLDSLNKSNKLRYDNAAQFCPVCLGEVSYHPLSWVPTEVTTCLKHQCLLVHKCKCGHVYLSIHDIVHRRCSRCGIDLANLGSDYISNNSFELFAQTMIQTWWGLNVPPKNWAIGTLLVEPVPILYRLFEVLTELVRVRWDWEYIYHLTASPPNMHIAQTRAFKALINWPQYFWDFLQEFLQREQRLAECNPFMFSRDHPLLIALLWELGEFPGCHFVQTALSQFLTENHFPVYSTYRGIRIGWSSALQPRMGYLSGGE